MKQWENTINRLIEAVAARRGPNDYNLLTAVHRANSTSPAPFARYPVDFEPSRSYSSSSQSSYGSISRYHGASGRYGISYVNDMNDGHANGNGFYLEGSGPNGYPQDETSEVDDDLEDYPPAYSSRSGTPVNHRRGAVVQSMYPERDSVPGYDRPRARTEDYNGPVMRQWQRSAHPMPPPSGPPPVGALPIPTNTSRPQVTRLSSNASDASFGQGTATRPSLRSKFSSTRLNSTYDSTGRATPPMFTGVPYRSRSSSQPSTYNPHIDPAPPLPTQQWSDQSKSSTNGSVPSSKRGSGSSASSSDFSQHSTSPVTPLGSSDTSLAGSTLRPLRSQNFMAQPNNSSSMVKIKVHFLEDIFVIQVPRYTEYDELVEKVHRKIRLCGARRDDGPLKVKYVDEDGDMISLGSTEDVQMAFEMSRLGNQVILHVQ